MDQSALSARWYFIGVWAQNPGQRKGFSTALLVKPLWTRPRFLEDENRQENELAFQSVRVITAAPLVPVPRAQERTVLF